MLVLLLIIIFKHHACHHNCCAVYDDDLFTQAAGTVVSIRQVLKTRYDHVPGSSNSYSHIVFLAHCIRAIIVQEVCYTL